MYQKMRCGRALTVVTLFLVWTFGINPKAANHYGDIRASLEKQGKTIGDNDLHIAGHARNEGLILETNNLRGFERIEGQRLENWA